MKTWQIVPIAVLASSLLVHTQWLKHPTPGVPRTPDGKPNLSAPVPRTADGKPDFSGIWQLEPRPCGPEGCGDYPPAPEFQNFGANLAGGLPYQAWAAELVKERSGHFGCHGPTQQ
jgi:hypothetical protein